MAKMDNICNDLLLEIFSYLPMKEQIKCSRVCHRWRDLFQYSPIFSLKICKRQNKEDELQAEFHDYHKFKCNNNLHKFYNKNIIYYDSLKQLSNITQNLLRQYKRLKALHFEVESLDELFSADLDNITDLELEHFEVIYSCNTHINGKIEKLLSRLGNKLKHLIVEPKAFHCSPFVCTTRNKYRPTSYFGQVGLELISTYLPNLEQLKFEPLTLVIESLGPIILPAKLKCLSLPKVRMSITELSNFDRHNHSILNELHFFDVNIPILRMICNMKNLKKCVLGKIRIHEPNDLLFLTNLKKLEHLQFELHFKNIDEILSELMQQLTKIRRLCLINCNISNDTIKDITSIWSKLEYLELYNQNNRLITDQVLEHLCGLDTLKALSLPFSSLTTGRLCNYIEKSKVEQLDISFSGELRIDEIVSSMIDKSLKNPRSKYHLIMLGHKYKIKENLQCNNISLVSDFI